MEDFSVHNHGSIVLLRPLSLEAKAWVEDYLINDETLMFCGAVVIEPRYVGPIIDGIVRDGLTVRGL